MMCLCIFLQFLSSPVPVKNGYALIALHVGYIEAHVSHVILCVFAGRDNMLVGFKVT